MISLRTSLKWLYPGMHVKRWWALGFSGLLCFLAGTGIIMQTHEGMAQPLAVRISDWLLHHVHLSSLRPGHLGVLLTLLGATICCVALGKLIHSLTSVLDPEIAPGGLVDLVYQRRKLAQGRRIVVIGGGTGLSTMLRGLKRYSANITAIVTVADDGGSSGKLQKQLHILPPGDIRNCLVALADAEPQMTELFQYRFRDSVKPRTEQSRTAHHTHRPEAQGATFIRTVEHSKNGHTPLNTTSNGINPEANQRLLESMTSHSHQVSPPTPPTSITIRDVLLPSQGTGMAPRIEESAHEQEPSQGAESATHNTHLPHPKAKQETPTSYGEGLRDHAFGNLLIAAMCAINNGDFERGVRETSRVLNVRGKVLPTTVDQVHLRGEMEDGSFIDGESNIANSPLKIKRIMMVPDDASPLQAVLDAIGKADVIVLGPGSVYTSVIPNLLVRGVPEALKRSRAKKVYVCNVMTQPGETDGYSASDHVRAIEAHARMQIFDYVLVNTRQPDSTLLDKYRKVGAVLVEPDLDRIKADGYCALPGDYINETDVVRHDAGNLASAIMRLLQR